MKTAIITGITGQDGAYLSKFLLEKGYNVIGITRSINSSNQEGLEFLGVLNQIQIIEANVFDLSNIIRILEKYKPDEFYNLAAQSSVGLSFEQPIGTLEYNIISVANILEAIRILGGGIKFYQSSSSEMFGNVPKYILPIEENFIIRPASPYAISKAAAHWIAVNYREAYKLFVSSGILFNHESVLRKNNFVTKKIVSGAIKIKEGKLDRLQLGNTSIKRDWGYAPLYVEAMWKMLNVENPGDYIVSSGEAHSLEEFVEQTFRALNLDYKKFISTNQNLLRPVDLEIIYGNPTKAKKELGWNYNMSFEELINKLIEDEYIFLSWKSKK